MKTITYVFVLIIGSLSIQSKVMYHKAIKILMEFK
jgi:hypothetical protein